MVEDYSPYIGSALSGGDSYSGNDLQVYDISKDCTKPKLLSTYDFNARAPHEFFLWKDPKHPGRVLAYVTHAIYAPDLSVIARSRAEAGKGSGADYLYTYLRSFYKDDTRPTGWNNMVLPNVAMPHAMWQLQGVRTVKMVEEKDPHDHTKTVHKFGGYEQVTPGTMSANEFDTATADLVGYLEWMAEPAQGTRKRLGVWVLLFLSLFSLLCWRLSASYWKEVK